MILLDTDVVSELMKPAPAAAVVAWIGARPAQSLYTTSITQAEILHGVMLLPAGTRRRALSDAADAMFREDFDGRILAFGSDAARPTLRSLSIAASPGDPSRNSTHRSRRLHAASERRSQHAT